MSAPEPNVVVKSVPRYDFTHPVCAGTCCCGGGFIEQFDYGDYVHIADYVALLEDRDALAARLADAERERDRETELRWNANRECVKMEAERDDAIQRAEAAERARDKFGSDALGYAFQVGKLRNTIATLTRDLAAARKAVDEWRRWADAAATGHPDAPTAVTDAEVRAVIEDFYGMDLPAPTPEGEG